MFRIIEIYVSVIFFQAVHPVPVFVLYFKMFPYLNNICAPCNPVEYVYPNIIYFPPLPKSESGTLSWIMIAYGASLLPNKNVGLFNFITISFLFDELIVIFLYSIKVFPPPPLPMLSKAEFNKCNILLLENVS